MNKLVTTAVAAALSTGVAFAAGDQGAYEDQKYSGPLHDQATDRLGDSEGVVGSTDRPVDEAELAQFETLDTNGDGIISREEAAEHDDLVANWQDIDADESGDVNRSEFSAFEQSGEGFGQKYSGPLYDQATGTLGDQEGVVASDVDESMEQPSDLARFETLDTDGDGVISREEAAEHDALVSNWEGIDADASDNIDRAEFSAFEESGFLDRDSYRSHNTGPLYDEANESEANPDVPGVPDVGR